MPLDPCIDKAEETVAEFGRKFWEQETEAAERRRLVAALVDSVWGDKGVVVAVKPRAPFLRYFQPPRSSRNGELLKRGVNGGSDGTRTRDCHPIEIRE